MASVLRFNDGHNHRELPWSVTCVIDTVISRALRSTSFLQRALSRNRAILRGPDAPRSGPLDPRSFASRLAIASVPAMKRRGPSSAMHGPFAFAMAARRRTGCGPQAQQLSRLSATMRFAKCDQSNAVLGASFSFATISATPGSSAQQRNPIRCESISDLVTSRRPLLSFRPGNWQQEPSAVR